MTEQVRLAFRVSAKRAAALRRISKTVQRSKSDLLREAVDLYLEDHKRIVAHVRRGMADAEAGNVVAHEEVVAWLKSWGTPDELPPPLSAKEKGRGK